MTFEMPKKRFRISMVIALVFIFVFASGVVTYKQFNYAKALDVTGLVTEIQWVTANHQLPRFVISNNAGKLIVLSQFTIALKPADIKVGDRLVKKRGDKFCLINGKKVRFSLY